MMFKYIAHLRRENIKSVSWTRINKDFVNMMQKEKQQSAKKKVDKYKFIKIKTVAQGKFLWWRQKCKA